MKAALNYINELEGHLKISKGDILLFPERGARVRSIADIAMLMMLDMGGMKVSEIAVIFGIDDQSVYGRIRYARTKTPTPEWYAAKALAIKCLMKPDALKKQNNAAVQKLIVEVCDLMKISRKALFSECRAAHLAKARWIVWYVMREYMHMTLSDIGRAFNRDHTSVMHAVKAIKKDEYLMKFIEVNRHRLAGADPKENSLKSESELKLIDARFELAMQEWRDAKDDYEAQRKAAIVKEEKKQQQTMEATETKKTRKERIAWLMRNADYSNKPYECLQSDADESKILTLA